MADQERIYERLRKVFALAEQGTEGEQQAARARLEEMLTKYGITLEDISEEKREYCHYKYTRHTQDIVAGVIQKISGAQVYWRMRAFHLSANVTKLQDLLIRDELEFYLKEFEKEFNALVVAFRSVNDLFNKTSSSTSSERKPLSEIELKALKLMLNMKPVTPLKKLNQ